MDSTGSKAEGDDLLGDAYEYLMRHFVTQSGKSKGQFYTPAEVSRVMAQLLEIPADTPQGHIQTYDYLVANPPFSVKTWRNGFDFSYGRFDGLDVLPDKNGDLRLPPPHDQVDAPTRQGRGRAPARRAVPRQCRGEDPHRAAGCTHRHAERGCCGLSDLIQSSKEHGWADASSGKMKERALARELRRDLPGIEEKPLTEFMDLLKSNDEYR